MALERLLIAFSVVTIGVSQVLYNLILNNPQHFPTSGLFFIYVIATVQLLPILMVAGMDVALTRLFANNWVNRGWRTLLFVFVAVSVVRQAQLLSVEPIRSWVLQIVGAHQLVWVVFGLAFLAAVWFGYRLLTSFFVYLTLLTLVLTGIFVYHAGLLGPAWADGAVYDGVVVGNATEVNSSELPPVFIIMWDGLEPDEVLKDGFFDAQFVPNFAALALDSVWFPNAKTNSRETDVAIMTFLTGTQPEDGELYEAPTLFERLAKHYEMHLYEEKAILARQLGCVNPAITCRGELYVRTRFPLNTAKWAMLQIVSQLVPARVFGFIGYFPSSYEPQISRIIDDIRASGGPGQLYYWHVILPHSPYVFNPDGTKHKPDIGARRKQIQFVDLLLGRFVATLKAEGLYDKSILVVISDHGQKYGCPCPIPLMIRTPGQSPMISAAEYTHIDFVPTLFDILDIPLGADERLEGKSVFASE